MARKRNDSNYDKWEHERGMRIIPPISYQEAVRKEKEEEEKQKKFKEWKKKHPDYSDVKIPKKAIKVKTASTYGEVGVDDSKLLFSETRYDENEKKILY